MQVGSWVISHVAGFSSDLCYITAFDRSAVYYF